MRFGELNQAFTSFIVIAGRTGGGRGRTGGGERERVRIGCIDREWVMRRALPAAPAAHGGRAGAAPSGAFLS